MVSLRKGLVGHWTMDDSDTSGGTLYDSSAYANDANVVSATTGQPGIVKDSYNIDGKNGESVQIGEFNNFPSTEMTVCFWVRTSDENGTVSYAIESEDNEFLIFRQQLFIKGPSTGFNAPFADGSWNHVALSWESSTGNTDIYINGALEDSITHQSGATIASGGSLVIAQDQDSKLGGFQLGQATSGDFDDVRIYDRVLSESEVNALYNMRSQRQQNTNGANVEDLVLHLNARDKRSVDQSNNRWKDISGNGNEAHGTSGNGVVDNNLFPNWEPVNGGRFILNGSEGFNVPGPIETTGQVSLESWFKRTDTSSDNEYLSDARNGSGNWHLTNYVGYNINFGKNLEANDPAGIDYTQSGSTASPDSNFFDKWTHLVATSDGNTSQLFIDGEQITDDRINESNPFQTGIGKDFAIANRYTGSAHLQGFIAVYRIYDRVLSPAQVKANYDSEKRFYE